MTTNAQRQFPLYWKLAVQFLALLALTIGGYALYLRATDNFHTVVAGEVYRSSQPSPEAIVDFEKRYGIKTIINLRGTSNPAWNSEVEQAEALGIKHIDFPMSAGKELSAERAQQLIQAMKEAPKPLLIHCLSGADRTGLASALYLAAITKTNEKMAEGQMSVFYGHISLPISRAFAMDRTFEKLEPLLGFSES